MHPRRVEVIPVQVAQPVDHCECHHSDTLIDKLLRAGHHHKHHHHHHHHTPQVVGVPVQTVAVMQQPQQVPVGAVVVAQPVQQPVVHRVLGR